MLMCSISSFAITVRLMVSCSVFFSGEGMICIWLSFVVCYRFKGG
jgi:hypothetical protein